MEPQNDPKAQSAKPAQPRKPVKSAPMSVSRTDPASLARMLELDENAWQHNPADPEMAAMLAHQLAAPITADLKLSDDKVTEAAKYGTVGGLLEHPAPPLWLLEEMKQLAKRNRAHGDPSVRQISTILYYDAIAAALVRCKSRITDLSDQELRQGFAWAKQQTWIDNKTRSRIESAAASLSSR